MKKKKMLFGMLFLSSLLWVGCGSNQVSQTDVVANESETVSTQEDVVEETAEENVAAETVENDSLLADGVYTVDFDTDSAMFHVNETCDGKGTLTVKNGEMTIHITLGSKKIVNLYAGLAEDAKKEDATIIEPSVDTVTYDDGVTEEVFGFDVSVPALDQEFDLALIGTKGVWYDHKVTVSNPVLQTLQAEPVLEDEKQEESAEDLEDGNYTVEIVFEGGSGKAKILSPIELTVEEHVMTARLVWSSPNYDYMVVGEEKYLPVNTEGDSVFEIPVTVFDTPITVIGDTVAMSKPHEVEYTITLLKDTVQTKE